jgi:type II secretory pathway component PulK
MGVNGERGQASIELVSVLPCVLLVAAVVWQLVLVGYTAWLTAHAARAAARADAVGRDAEAAARSTLPRSLERGLEVDRTGTGGVRVSVRIPLVTGAWEAPVRIAAVSSLGASQ